MKDYPLVTVGIPIKNGEDTIQYTLENLMLSNYPLDRFEVVAGNHGSTDATESIIRSFQTRYRNIQLINIPDDGPNRSKVRNKITGASRGEILIFIDHDILVPRDFIDRHVELHLNNNKVLVAGYTFGKQAVFKLDINEFDDINLHNIDESYAYLKSKPIFYDFREEKYSFIKSEETVVDLTDKPAPFRFFYSCNLSLRKRTLEQLGGFDEAYNSWGLEDDDLAYRFQLNKGKMLFSHDAWGFHIPHPTNPRANSNSWRENREYFIKKYQTRELELFYIYAMEMSTGFDALNFFRNLTSVEEQAATIAKISLPPRKGRRLGILMSDEKRAEQLDLTHCFLPSLERNAVPYKVNNRSFWSLFGVMMPFEEKSMDETIIIVDTLMFAEPFLLKLMLLEIARVSKKVLCYQGNVTRNNEFRFMRESVQSAIKYICFNAIEMIDV